MSILSIQNLSKTYQSGSRKLTVLENVNFEIQAGETISIVGPSGSGKTTLLGLCAGLDSGSTGSVVLNGQALEKLNEDQRAAVRNKDVGFIFQNFQLLPTLTALENVRRNNTGQTQNRWRYGSALLFGLIHGMGFSNYLKSMLGKDESIITQLLAFNVGLELGQLLIVAAVFFIAFVFVQLLNIKRSNWTLFVSGGIFGISLIMALERLPF